MLVNMKITSNINLFYYNKLEFKIISKTQATSSKAPTTEASKRDKPKFVPNLGLERVKREV